MHFGTLASDCMVNSWSLRQTPSLKVLLMGSVLLQYSQQCIATDLILLPFIQHVTPTCAGGCTEAVFKLTPGAQTQILKPALMHSPQSAGFCLKVEPLHNHTFCILIKERLFGTKTIKHNHISYILWLNSPALFHPVVTQHKHMLACRSISSVEHS